LATPYYGSGKPHASYASESVLGPQPPMQPLKIGPPLDDDPPPLALDSEHVQTASGHVHVTV
jgi:hypothetical protein